MSGCFSHFFRGHTVCEEKEWKWIYFSAANEFIVKIGTCQNDKEIIVYFATLNKKERANHLSSVWQPSEFLSPSKWSWASMSHTTNNHKPEA